MIRRALFWARRFAEVAAHTVCMRTKDRVIDSPNITFDRARELDATIPEWAWRLIANYTPLGLTASQWAPIREFVAETTVRMKARTFDGVRRVNSMTSGFVGWVHAIACPDLTVSAVYTPHHVDRYLRTAAMTQKSPAYRWGVSCQLAKIARELEGVEIPRVTSAPPKHSAKVLTDAEIASLYSWSRGLTTDHARRNAAAILALSAGAGLTLEEIAEARVEDVRQIDTDELVLVKVRGARERTIPLLRIWANSLLLAIDGRSSGLIFRGFRDGEYPPRCVHRFLDDHPAPLRPSVRDLRRSWFILQLEAGLPTDVLCRAGGFKTVRALDNYVGYARPTADAIYFARIAEAGAR